METTTENHVPDQYRYAVIPHIMLDDAAAAIEFYKQAFGARELFRLDSPDGGIHHAEIAIGQSTLMLGDLGVPETDENDWRNPRALGGTTVTLHVFVPDVDAIAEQAESAGATIVTPPEDTFYGARNTILADPHGHLWIFLTHLEEVSVDDARRRMQEVEPA